MKQIQLLFSIGMLLCLNSCAPSSKEQPKAEESTMMTTDYNAMVVRHQVGDYATFKSAFMAHDSMRTASGITDMAVGRGMDDPNTVIIIGRIADVQKAKDFTASPSLKDAMMKAGVTGPPMFDFMHVIMDDTSTIPQHDRIMLIHHVKDFDAWLKVYNAEGTSTRATNGLVDRGMGRGIDDPNMVYLLFAITDMAKAKARYQSEDLKKLMMDAGVDSAPSMFMFTWDTSK